MACEICDLLDNEFGLVLQTDHWKAVVIADQGYLGRCVVSVKRHCPSLSELSVAEWLNFKEVVIRLEGAAKVAFKADLINWSCLMDGAFIKEPFNPHVHWHFRPRYKNPVIFAGKTFTDSNIREAYREEWANVVDANMVNKIATVLREGSD